VNVMLELSSCVVSFAWNHCPSSTSLLSALQSSLLCASLIWWVQQVLPGRNFAVNVQLMQKFWRVRFLRLRLTFRGTGGCVRGMIH